MPSAILLSRCFCLLTLKSGVDITTTITRTKIGSNSLHCSNWYTETFFTWISRKSFSRNKRFQVVLRPSLMWNAKQFVHCCRVVQFLGQKLLWGQVGLIKKLDIVSCCGLFPVVRAGHHPASQLSFFFPPSSWTSVARCAMSQIRAMLLVWSLTPLCKAPPSSFFVSPKC